MSGPRSQSRFSGEGLLREPQLLHECGPPWVGAKVLQQRVDLEVGDTRVTQFIRALEPLERTIQITTPCMDACNLVGRLVAVLLDQLSERRVRCCSLCAGVV